jgi:hypothetical protein
MSVRQSAPRLRIGPRWIAGVAGVAAASAVVISALPASASNTVNAQLSLSGVATSSNVLGGSKIEVRPGDTVDFHASALPTAGLSSVPGLGSVLQDALSPLLGQYQVVVTTASDFPGGAQTVTLGGPTSGSCAGKSDLAVPFPAKGTYNFTWSVQYALPTLLGCTKSGMSGTDLNQLKAAGVAINASNHWTGQIVVTDNPGGGGISIQPPVLGASPSVPVLGQLPSTSITLPGVPTVSVPNLPSLPIGGGTSNPPGGGTSTPPGGSYTPPPTTVPQKVVPSGSTGQLITGGGGTGGFGALPDSGTLTPLSGSGPSVIGQAPSSTAAPIKDAGLKRSVSFAANKAPTALLPVMLAVVAIIALAIVTATYARLYLLRRNV